MIHPLVNLLELGGGWVGGGGSQVHNNATACPNLGLLDSNQLDSKLGPSVAKISSACHLKDLGFTNLLQSHPRFEILEHLCKS